MSNKASQTVSLAETKNWYVASLLLHVKPEKLVSVKQTISTMPHTEIHAETEEGKLVVVIEADVEHDLVNKMEKLERLEGITAFSLIYSQRDEA